MEDSLLFTNRFSASFRRFLKENRVILCASLVFGLLAFTYAFTNKLVHHDDVNYLFSKGETISSGRWGLELMRLLFPDFSMPWIYGVIGLLLLAASNCLVIRTFGIRDPLLQSLLSGLLITFAPVASAVTYMFVFSSYCLAILCASAAVCFSVRRTRAGMVKAVGLTVLSLSIYQAYFTYIASLLLTALIVDFLLRACSWKELVRTAAFYLLHLALSFAIYFGINAALQRLTGQTFNEYAQQGFSLDPGNLLSGVKNAYLEFYRILTKFEYGIFPTQAARIAGLLLLAADFALLLYGAVRQRSLRSLAVLPLLLLVPLALNAVCVVSQITHTLTFYSYGAVFVFSAVLFSDALAGIGTRRKTAAGWICTGFAALFCLLLASNIYCANRAALRMQIMDQQTRTFYTTLFSELRQMPEFNAQSRIALISDGEIGIAGLPESLENGTPTGTWGVTPFIYSNEKYVSYYLGVELHFASEEETEQLRQTEAFRQMPSYPYYGSMCAIDDYIVVKLDGSSVVK